MDGILAFALALQIKSRGASVVDGLLLIRPDDTSWFGKTARRRSPRLGKLSVADPIGSADIEPGTG